MQLLSFLFFLSSLAIVYNCICIDVFCRFKKKCIRRIWKIDSKTHNDLLHHFNNCLPIDILLEKRCIKFSYNKL